MIPNINHKLFDIFKKKYEKILYPVILDLKKQDFTEKDIDKFINLIFNTHKIEKKVSDVIIDLSINAINLGGIKTTYDKSKKWLLKNSWNEDNLNLGSTIHKNINKTKKNISLILKENLGASVNWQKSAQKIYKIKELKAELPKYIDDLIKQSKKVLQNPTLINDYKKQIKLVQKQIDKLSNLGYKNPRLQKSYQNIINQIKKKSVEGLNAAIERAIKSKTHYYAQRIARTEIANSYGNAVLYNAKKNKMIVGVKSVLSSRHPKLDICDIHHSVNQYGMGKGVFPIIKLPPYPYHVHCMCNLIPVTKNQISFTKKVNRNKQIEKFSKENPKLKNLNDKIPFLTSTFHKIKKPVD